MKLSRHIGLWVSRAKDDLVFEVFCRSLWIPLPYQLLTTKVKHRYTFRHVIVPQLQIVMCITALNFQTTMSTTIETEVQSSK